MIAQNTIQIPYFSFLSSLAYKIFKTSHQTCIMMHKFAANVLPFSLRTYVHAHAVHLETIEVRLNKVSSTYATQLTVQ